MIRTAKLVAFLWLAFGALVSARAAEPGTSAHGPRPVHLFAQAGSGFVEVLHAEVGAFMGPRITVEGMVAATGVFGVRYGGGVMLALGRTEGPRPPRHAFLVGTRVMLDESASFKTRGDDLSSYGLVVAGYSFLAPGGFTLRATGGLAIVREQNTTDGGTPGAPPIIAHQLGLAGPMINIGIGFAWGVGAPADP